MLTFFTPSNASGKNGWYWHTVYPVQKKKKTYCLKIYLTGIKNLPTKINIYFYFVKYYLTFTLCFQFLHLAAWRFDLSPSITVTVTTSMNLTTPIHHSYHPNFPTPNPRFNRFSSVSTSTLRILKPKTNPIFITNCISPTNEVTDIIPPISPIEEETEENIVVVEKPHLSGEVSQNDIDGFVENDSLWNQILEIAKFSGPAVGLWICGPLMSLIDTAVIGQGSSTELAALGIT